MLAYLHKGERLRTLADGFGISEATAWRRVRETIGLLAAKATGLRQALRRAKSDGWAFVILDGTLIRTQRHRLDRPFHSGKHRHHGMNLQAIASPTGELLWVSGPYADRSTTPPQPESGCCPGSSGKRVCSTWHELHRWRPMGLRDAGHGPD
ncbi:hypothetical protein GCM10028833_42330 [Glycomyces tarimensis]